MTTSRNETISVTKVTSCLLKTPSLSVTTMRRAQARPVVTLLWLAASLQLVSASSPRDPALYPACVNDEDCAAVTSARGTPHRCFQYMCYPWTTEAGPLRPCRRR